MDLDLVLRTSLLLAAAAIIARLLRHAAPSTRHLLWHTAIVLVLAGACTRSDGSNLQGA